MRPPATRSHSAHPAECSRAQDTPTPRAGDTWAQHRSPRRRGRSEVQRRPVRARPFSPAGRDGLRDPLGVPRGGDEAQERGGGHARPGLVLRVELDGQVEGVVGGLQLDDVHALLPLVLPGEDQAHGLELLLVRDVELVAVPVPLHDAVGPAVEAGAQRLLRVVELDPPGAQSHVGPHRLLGDLGHVHDDMILRDLALVELLAGGVRHAQHVARELDDGDLHAQTDAEVGLPPLPGEARRPRLALDASVTEAAGNEDAVRRAEACLRLQHALGRLRVVHPRRLPLQVGGVDPDHLQLALDGHRGVVEGRDHRLVGVAAPLVVLADERDHDLVGLLCEVDLLREVGPVV
mmetsp:Transcript_84133/g.234336  ORF Transcript_84133/g.234336 Transcript_84133/m.234336 type:complete len:348 (-) Transcript_84133:484-1527(-)